MLNRVLTALIKVLLLVIILLLFDKACMAGSIFELNEVSLEYKAFSDGSFNPLIDNNGLTNKRLDKELNLYVNTTLFKYGFINNKIHSYTDRDENGNPGQFRLVSWNYSLGVHITYFLDLSYEHKSEHLLDSTFPYHFPLENSINIKIYLYKDKPFNSIF